MKFHAGTVEAQHFRSCSSKENPMPSTFSHWRTSFQTEVCSGSTHPAEAVPWIKEVEMATSVDDLKTSRSIWVTFCPNFETLDVRIATALKMIIPNSNFT